MIYEELLAWCDIVYAYLFDSLAISHHANNSSYIKKITFKYEPLLLNTIAVIIEFH